MKKLIFLAFAAVAFLASGIVASAQYAPTSLTNYRGSLQDQNGHTLTEAEAIQLVGEDIYNATYKGACKQYKAGNTLVIVGSIVAGVGTVGTIAGYAATNYAIERNHITFEEKNGKKVITSMDDKAKLAVTGLIGGLTLLVAGEVALAAGIPLKIIGNKRIDWVAGQYNRANTPVASIRFGAGQYGTGVVLNF